MIMSEGMVLQTISQCQHTLFLEVISEPCSAEDAIRDLRSRCSIVSQAAQEEVYKQLLPSPTQHRTHADSRTFAIVSPELLRCIHRHGPVHIHGQAMTQISSTDLPVFLAMIQQHLAYIDTSRVLVPVFGRHGYYFLLIDIELSKTVRIQLATVSSKDQSVLHLEDGAQLSSNPHVALMVQKLPS